MLTVKAMMKEMQPERRAGFLPQRWAWKAAGKGPKDAPIVIMEAMRDPSRTVITRPRGFRFLSTIGSNRSAIVFEDHAMAMPTAIVDRLTTGRMKVTDGICDIIMGCVYLPIIVVMDGPCLRR